MTQVYFYIKILHKAALSAFWDFYRGLKALLSSSSAIVSKWWQITTPHKPRGWQFPESTANCTFITFFLLRSWKVCLLCHVWNKSVSSLLCNNIKYVARAYLHCFLLFSFLHFPYLQEGTNEAVTPAVISKLIWRKKIAWGAKWFWSNSKQWKIQYVANCWPWRQICGAWIVGYVLQVSFYSPSSMWDMTGY